MSRFDDLPRVPDTLSPGERLRVACELSDAAIVLVRSRLCREHPEMSAADVDQMVATWLAERPGAEHGDGAGRVVDWPRTNSAE